MLYPYAVTLMLSLLFFCINISSTSSVIEDKINCEECSTKYEDCVNKECDNEREKRIICYFTNWAWYRKDKGKFTPDNIDPSLCTHINYAFAVIDNSTLTTAPSDSWADIDNKFFTKVTDFISKGIKVLLSLGGWNDSAPNRGWPRLIRNETARAVFIKDLIEFLKRYKFCGADFDLEYPGSYQGDNSTGLPSDKEEFNKMMSEVKTAFEKHGLLLSVTVPAGEKNINYYNMAPLCGIADWINIMCYDYKSHLDGILGANAPFCGTKSDWGVYQSVNYFLIQLKCPPEKLVLGMPFYGQTFTCDASSSPSQAPEWGQKIAGAGDAGPYTANAGTMAYYEICLNIKYNGWSTCWNKYNDSLAWKGNQAVSYDGPEDITRKCCFINDKGLLGAMFWTLDYDDFNNVCGGGRYPLLTRMNELLRCYKKPE